MFGSDFFGNFGIPQFPFQGTDPQGGLFGPNQEQMQPDPMATSQRDVTTPAAVAPAAGQPASSPLPGIGSPSPMGGAVQPPGSMPQTGGLPDQTQQPTPPAAGLASPFGRPML